MFNAAVVSIVMVIFEIIFCIWLILENKSLNKKNDVNFLIKPFGLISNYSERKPCE